MIVSTSTISTLLIQLFRIHNRISLPGLGAFVAEYQPATFSNDGTHMTPPSKKIVFRTNEVWNDGYLEEALATKENTTKEEAKKELSNYVRQLISELNNGEKVIFNDFGTLYKKLESSYYFELAQGVNLLPESFGLQELDVKPVSTVIPPLTPITPLTSAAGVAPAITPLSAEPISSGYTSPKSSYMASSTPSTSTYGNPKKTIAPPPASKGNRGIGWWILVIIVVLLVAAAFVFKKQFGELYDKWYYTPTEQELLKRYNSGERG